MNEPIVNSKTLILATTTASGHAHASYAPFVSYEERFYILVSNLAEHTTNLKTSKQCHILLIEDESQATNLFARKRVSFHCTVGFVSRSEPLFAVVIQKLFEKFGPTVRTLEALPDFQMIQLEPTSGLQVTGFSQAQRLQFPPE